MISNHSSFKIFKEEYKKYIWALALTIIGFISSKIILPLLDYSNYINTKNRFVQNLSNDEEYLLKKLELLNDYLTIDNDFNKVVVIGLAVLLGAVIFSYLHNKKKIDFYHSLPITRINLFFIKYFLGIAIALPIIIVSHLLLYGIFSILLGGNIIAFKEVLEAVFIDIVFFIVIYSITVFANILAGNTIIGIILSGVLLNLFSIMILVIFSLSDIFFSQVIDLGYIFDYQLKYNPIICYLGLKNNLDYFSITSINFSKFNILSMYILITLIITIINLILFKIRKSEKASVCISFKYAKTILKYLGVCIGAVLVGVIFYLISNSIFALYLGVILGCIILHCLVEIIYDFDFRAIFKNWYSIIGCFVICCLIIFSYQFDIFKRIDYVPSIDKIENVDINIYNDSEEAKNIQSQDVIQAALELHKEYLESTIEKNKYSTENIKIKYKLKNGSILVRYIGIDYPNLEDEEIPNKNNLLSKIINDKEYIEKAYSILYRTDIKEDDITTFIYDNSGNSDEPKDNFKYDNKKLIENIKKDIEQNGIYTVNEEVLFSIRFYIERSWEYEIVNNSYTINISNKYKNTLNYLESLNIYPEDIKIEDVDYIYDENKNLNIKDEDGIKKVLSDYKLRNLLGFEVYKKPIQLILVDKQGVEININISEELYKQLEESYKSK